LEIQQWIRNDYWVGPAPYTNTTTGSVYVNVHLASSVTNQAQPLRDDAGSQALFVPPQSYGATGGVWQPAALAGHARLGIWSDPSSPLKWGCEETAFVPPGLPGLAGGSPATSCASSSESPSSTNDCTAVPGTQRCKPANLVYGDGVDDGRCSLVGLSW